MEPFALVKQGVVIFKNGTFIKNVRGFTFLNEMPKNESIYSTIVGNMEKTFLKFYSTHLDTKIVQEDLINPCIK